MAALLPTKMETVFCSCNPFGEQVTTCCIKILQPRASSVALGLCLIKHGKIDQSWKFSSDGTKFCGHRVEPYGESFDVGDVITVRLQKGSLSFEKNGKDFGVCYSGFDEQKHYYLRGYMAAGMLSGFPIMGKANGGCMEIIDPEHRAPSLMPGTPVRIAGLQSRTDLNGQSGYVLHKEASGRLAIRLDATGGEVAVNVLNLEESGVTSETLSSRDVRCSEERGEELAPSHASTAGAASVDLCEARVDTSGAAVAECRTCGETLMKASFSQRSWKNRNRGQSLPQCLRCT